MTKGPPNPNLGQGMDDHPSLISRIASSDDAHARLSIRRKLSHRNRPMTRGFFMRIGLVALVYGIVLVGSSLGLHQQDDWHKDHPASRFFSFLNSQFKARGWLLTAVVWAFLLASLYYRQRAHQENVTWKRQAAVDVFLWVGGSLYWLTAIKAFERVADSIGHCRTEHAVDGPNLDVLDCVRHRGQWIKFDISGHAFLCSVAISLLAEEYIRALAAGGNIFTLYTIDQACQRSRRIWTMAVVLSAVLCTSWLLLFFRTAIYYHTMEEKLLGVTFGLVYWLIVIAIRSCARVRL